MCLNIYVYVYICIYIEIVSYRDKRRYMVVGAEVCKYAWFYVRKYIVPT